MPSARTTSTPWGPRVPRMFGRWLPVRTSHTGAPGASELCGFCFALQLEVGVLPAFSGP